MANDQSKLDRVNKTVVDGEFFELYASKVFHQRGVPILVSPLLLRKRDLGQIDLCVKSEKSFIAAECKLGEGRVSLVQRKRLLKSLKFISFLFNEDVKLELLYGFAKSFESAYSFKSKKIGELR